MKFALHRILETHNRLNEPLVPLLIKTNKGGDAKELYGESPFAH